MINLELFTHIVQALTPILSVLIPVVGTILVAVINKNLGSPDKEEEEPPKRNNDKKKERITSELNVQNIQKDISNTNTSILTGLLRHSAVQETRIDELQKTILEEQHKNKLLSVQNLELQEENASLRNQLLAQGLRLDAIEKRLMELYRSPTR